MERKIPKESHSFESANQRKLTINAHHSSININEPARDSGIEDDKNPKRVVFSSIDPSFSRERTRGTGGQVPYDTIENKQTQEKNKGKFILSNFSGFPRTFDLHKEKSGEITL